MKQGGKSSGSMKTKSWLLWMLALLLVLCAAVYQRLTGPSYPVRGTAQVNSLEVAFRLPRSHESTGDAEVRLSVPEPEVQGKMEYRRFRSNDDWSRLVMERQGEHLVARIPMQPPAGKVMYRIVLRRKGGAAVPLTTEPVIIRFRGPVPPWILYPHILLMFVAMLISTRAGLEVISKGPGVYPLTLWTIFSLVLGGLILGPIVQKYAFGAFWTGWPLGQDLTDNKTVIAALFWFVALWRLKKNRDATNWALAAAVVLMAVYAIPHSVLGSELDYTRMDKMQ